MAAERYALWVEYDGTAFYGSQRQTKEPTVQSDLEEALSRLERDGDRVPVVLAGRTDAGVHATGMVVHADLHRRLDEAVLLSSLNATLDPSRIGVVAARRCTGSSFHAQRSAVERTYVYRIQHGCGMADPHEVVERADACPALVRRGWLSVVRDRNRALCLRETLDVDAMLAAARTLACGAPRDFSALASQSGLAGAQPVRQLTELSVIDEVPDALSEHTRHGARGRSISVVARSRAFLKSQVRRMVACLIECGRGAMSAEALEELLATRDPSRAPPPAPAHGLYLADVKYAEESFEPRSGGIGAAIGHAAEPDTAAACAPPGPSASPLDGRHGETEELRGDCVKICASIM